jgi:hypothetical protein
MDVQSGMVQRASGLVVPAATLDKKQERLTRDEFRLLLRLFKLGRAHHMLAMFVCVECKQPVQIRQHDRIVTEVPTATGPTNAPGGTHSLACGCTDWTVR